MTIPNTFTLVDPLNGNLAFKLYSFEDNSHFDHIQRLNYYSLIWIKSGTGIVKSDFSQCSFTSNTLFSFTPYQPFMIQTDQTMIGLVIHFHPDFFCIHKHHQDVACSGVLFNNIYEPPMVTLDEAAIVTFETLIDQVKIEMQNPALAQHELLVSYLKILLISATRLKNLQNPALQENKTTQKEPFILQNLKEYIEVNFKTKHSASEYADMLHITPKALAKITKTHFNKTITHLITERIIIEAKRELYLTNKAVKEIAYDLGYDDEHYFSRFFKNNADVSPQMYRDTVGYSRAAFS